MGFRCYVIDTSPEAPITTAGQAQAVFEGPKQAGVTCSRLAGWQDSQTTLCDGIQDRDFHTHTTTDMQLDYRPG
jgi:hypothetical protein